MRSIKAYNYQIGVGYPLEKEEEIEAAIEKSEVIDTMREYLQKGIV
nr:hypothetical protein [uncultured Lachnoclostridium sp.]